jgi:hypothetical protein
VRAIDEAGDTLDTVKLTGKLRSQSLELMAEMVVPRIGPAEPSLEGRCDLPGLVERLSSLGGAAKLFDKPAPFGNGSLDELVQQGGTSRREIRNLDHVTLVTSPLFGAAFFGEAPLPGRTG